ALCAGILVNPAVTKWKRPVGNIAHFFCAMWVKPGLRIRSVSELMRSALALRESIRANPAGTKWKRPKGVKAFLSLLLTFIEPIFVNELLP
ncbi:MAG: hypothetical protein GX419_01425, partial [Bacteroidales bacterium]|nr:hypothetical protein [Bacteroidales bacterium]